MSGHTLREWAMTRPASHRAIGERRAAACRRLPKRASKEIIERAGREIAAELGVDYRRWKEWRATVRGHPEEDWPALLMPRWSGRAVRAEIPPPAWDFFRTLYLSRRQPTVADCVRRTREAAEANGWGPVPSTKTFQRRVKTDLNARERVLKRHGEAALARLFPSQRRDRRQFEPGQAVSGDGLKFDQLHVRFPDGEVVSTTTGWFWQDVPTGLILAWEVAKTETMDLYRRATRSLAETCVPTDAWVDNTMVAASKTMTGRQAGRRYRGRKKDDDPIGLLAALGIEVHHTNPDPVLGNPGSKPIERAFGTGGLHDAVAKHPRFRTRGYSAKTAVPLSEFRAVVAEEVERHNQRPGRRTPACKGTLSFRQAWDRAVARLPAGLRRATPQQLDVLSRMPEVVTVSKTTGEIRLSAGRGPLGRHRYWDELLVDHAGKKAIAYYNPDDFAQPIAVTTLDGRHLCTAAQIADAGFADKKAAQEWSRARAEFVRTTKRAAKAEERMTAAEAAAAYPAPDAAPPPAPDPGVTRPVFGQPRVELEAPARATGTEGAPPRRRRAVDSELAALVAPVEDWDD